MTATLLAVDDSKTMRKVIEITFAGENYRMVMAENPTDAMTKLRSEKPSIALVDALLGGSSGYDLCQQIKSEAPQVGVIVLSSKQHPYDRVKGSAVGADDFLDKPYDTQALIDKVAALAQKIASAPAAKPAAAPAARPAAAPAQATAPAVAPSSPQATAAAAAQTTAQAQAGKPHTTTMSFANPGQARAAMAPAAAPAVAPAPTRPAPVAAPAVASQQPVRPAAVATPTAAASAGHPARPAPGAGSAVPVQPAAAAAASTLAASAQGVTAAIDASMETKLSALGLTKDQIAGVVALSREVVEQVVWEVVPLLAETMIREEIRRLSAE